MRPTLSEQVDGVRRVLTDLVAGEVEDPFTQEQITHAVAALEHIAARWSRVLPDLVTDIRALEEVLGIEAVVLDEAVAGVVDLAAAEDYHRNLRSQLTDVIMNGPEPSPEVRAYLADSIERL